VLPVIVSIFFPTKQNLCSVDDTALKQAKDEGLEKKMPGYLTSGLACV